MASPGIRYSIYGPGGIARNYVTAVPIRASDGSLVYIAGGARNVEDIQYREGKAWDNHKDGEFLRLYKDHGEYRYGRQYGPLSNGSTLKGQPRSIRFLTPSIPVIKGPGMAPPAPVDYVAVAQKGASDSAVVATFLRGFNKNTDEVLKSSWRDLSSSDVQRTVVNMAYALAAFYLLQIEVVQPDGSKKTLTDAAGADPQKLLDYATSVAEYLEKNADMHVQQIKEGSHDGESKFSDDFLRRLPLHSNVETFEVKVPETYRSEFNDLVANLALDIADADLGTFSFLVPQPLASAVLLQEKEALDTLRVSALVSDVSALQGLPGPIISKFARAFGIDTSGFKTETYGDLNDPANLSDFTDMQLDVLGKKLEKLIATTKNLKTLLPEELQ